MSPENTPHHGFFLIIPAFVADDPDLDDATKMLFGRLTALSNKYGYCFASDKYIADLCGCGDRVITDRLKILEDKEYIRRETQKEGFITKRKIYPLFEFQKSFTKGTTMPSREAQPCPLGGNARAHKQDNNNSISKTTTEAAPPAAVPLQQKLYPCLESLDIPESDKYQIAKAYPEDVVKNAVTWATHPETKINKSLAQAIKWACKEKPTVPKMEKDVFLENKTAAEKIVQSIKVKPKYINIEILASKVEINFTGQIHPILIEYKEKSFKDQFISALRKLNVVFNI